MSYSIFWFRRDLRLKDNAGFYRALKGEYPVKPIFIFDENILSKLPDKKDARVEFIYDVISELKSDLKDIGSDIEIYYGKPEKVWIEIAKDADLKEVYTNRDYEQYAINRDKVVSQLLDKKSIPFKGYKDHVIFDKDEVLKDDGDPYVVFTPYKRKWMEALESKMEDDLSFYLKSYPCEKYYDNLLKYESEKIVEWEDLGFERTEVEIPSETVKQKTIKEYDEKRNFPSVDGTSRLGIHFRFGTISIREKARKAQGLNETFLSELVWRDFYSMILQHYPKVEEGAFREKYEAIKWINDEDQFQRWCEGKTGYPIVDAGMRELNETGYMHNRVRMITASFLTKHLLIDWRWGEQYFADKLLDYDLASNNGGWQWAAGCGTDAAPYFRIFNPYSQQQKFDKDMKYIKQWVPEVDSDKYPDPIVDHKEARERCLETYKEALN